MAEERLPTPREPTEAGLGFDQLMERLRGTVSRLEQGNQSLEQSLQSFEEGIKMSRRAAEILDQAERRIELLVRGEDGVDRPQPQALGTLGAQGSGLQVLFVTLDPQHDTQAALAQAMANFDPAFVGLRGDAAQTRQVIGDFRLVLQRLAAAGKDAGEIGHSAGTYVFDRHGKLRLYAAYGTAHEAFEHDFRLLLSER